MNMFKFFPLVVVLALMLPSATEVLAKAKAQEPEGYIVLAENENGTGDTCRLPIVTDYFNMKYHGCKNDQMSFFRLESVPSATIIGFYSDYDCPEFDSPAPMWRYKIRTYIELTDTRFISIERELNTANPGDIVVKGVRMEYKYHSGGQIKGKLSCVRIWKSDIVTP
ncbi:hypothetical protein [Pseudomonas sp. MWU13-2105]|uniref:hypothetical protein n=1 Tax=Pseudomonas sp. MWU13-2105 TaxID=2935074 RepID=UPI00200BA326|nr:hypothetical protein [Pseudomonas sp. MWU13-2105]